MDKARYIAIDGPIGVGKSSLVELLTKELDGRAIFEPVDKNPFLEAFYQNQAEYAFRTQISFLLNRYQQQVELSQTELFSQTVVSDYLFAKDRIFAYLNLDDQELALYEKIYNLLNEQIVRPDLVIFLQTNPEVLLKRIQKRNLPYDRYVPKEYLAEVIRAYNQFFFHYHETPLLVVNTTKVDFFSSKDELFHLIKKIEQRRKGVEHYIPLGSK